MHQSDKSGSNRFGFILVMGMATTTALMPGCLAAEVFDCRQVGTEELSVECEDNDSPFTGELHFDSVATYETFLSHQCMPSAPESAILTKLSQVDFTKDAVFVAVGPNAIDSSRCIEIRELDSAEVCSSGLKVYFDDTYQNSIESGCQAGRWTVAFSMSRDDLRAALEAGDREPFFD